VAEQAGRRWVPFALAGLAVVVIALGLVWWVGPGFSGDDGQVEVLDQYDGPPTGVTPDASGQGAVVVGDEVHVYTSGSSTCPLLPTNVEVDGTDLLVTVGVEDEDAPCTADYVVTTSVIAVPDGVDPADVSSVSVVNG
jgi:hypothetical protein